MWKKLDKRKPISDDRRGYWIFALLLTAVLALMVRFPLRILDVGETRNDVIFYGVISVLCLLAGVWIWTRFGKQAYRLTLMMLLCVVLSGWQVIDLAVLRSGFKSPAFGFYPGTSDGLAWYYPRVRNEEILCHSIVERYYGNNYIAITLEIDREATWMACGG